MLVLGGDMLSKCNQMLALLQWYAGKVLPYANAARWLWYDITAGPMQLHALCDVVAYCEHCICRPFAL